MEHYFVETKDNNSFLFDKETSHHIINVMRHKDNDEVICVYKKEFYRVSLLIEQKNVIGNIINKLEINKQCDGLCEYVGFNNFFICFFIISILLLKQIYQI